MPITIEFYFDYLSPYTYLANVRLPSLKANIAYKPVFIMDVMQLVNNQPSPKCPPKARYASVDAERWARRSGVPLVRNTSLWKALKSGDLDARRFIRGALAAQETGNFERYHAAIFNAVWCTPRDLVSEEGRNAVLQDSGLVSETIWNLADSPEMHLRLEQCVSEAAGKGVFGTPTFIVNDEMFFGNDRLDFVAERIAAGAALS
jgi:2-hydroxychromene-2-carboxylate isomerase